LHGKGNQKFLTKDYEEDRQRALEDRTRFSEDELTNLEITTDQGRGKTDHRRYEIWQWPFPIDRTIRKRKKIDIRDNYRTGWD
jgi:hypothetical protein